MVLINEKFSIQLKSGGVNKAGRSINKNYTVIGYDDKSSKFKFVNDLNEFDAIEEFYCIYVGNIAGQVNDSSDDMNMICEQIVDKKIKEALIPIKSDITRLKNKDAR